MKDGLTIPEGIPSLMSSNVAIVMNSDAIILESDRFVDEAINLMKDRNDRSVLASHKGEVVGLVSKTDILYKQAQLNNLDVDTRSDVYSLGVLLYELLTGSPPFSKQDLEKRGM